MALEVSQKLQKIKLILYLMENIKEKGSIKNTIIIILLSGITLLSLALSGYLFYSLKISPKTADEKIVKEVGKMMVLPEETPVIATVEDINKVKDQPFFKNALNGDKVLAFVQSKKAILYRPSTGMIIEVGPLVVTYGQETDSSETQ